jgi:hypothetical protein
MECCGGKDKRQGAPQSHALVLCALCRICTSRKRFRRHSIGEHRELIGRTQTAPAPHDRKRLAELRAVGNPIARRAAELAARPKVRTAPPAPIAGSCHATSEACLVGRPPAGTRATLQARACSWPDFRP